MSKLTRNEITGDYLKSKVNTHKYRQNYDRIFHKKTGEVDVSLAGSDEGVKKILEEKSE